jgi:HPt (histidine-containing phosphotransfer) domain-containing protein
LIQGFQDGTPGALARIREALQESDAQMLAEAAHRLRGQLAFFSAPAAEVAARLEAMGDSGQLHEAASALASLTEMVGRLGPQLAGLSMELLQHRAADSGPA